MAKGRRRHPLVIYTYMIDRWWPAIFVLGLALLSAAWALYSRGLEQWCWLGMAGKDHPANCKNDRDCD